MVVGLIRDIFKEDTARLVIDDKDDYNRLMHLRARSSRRS